MAPSSHRPSPYTVPLYDTTALTAALANPYAQRYTLPHYYQAYAAHSHSPPRTTVDGYTLSSKYVPDAVNHKSRPVQTVSAPSLLRSQTTVKPILNHLTHGSWYQPGNGRCTRPGCPFTGSRRSVEIHMMDRHFIFPPGWEKRDDWDADPSLKGKSIAIQGTSVTLDTPDAVDAWIAERKRRFPTEEAIRDKKRKLDEAAARGQLTLEDMSSSARKRFKQNMASASGGRTEGRGQERSGGHVRRSFKRCKENRTEHMDESKSQSPDAIAKCIWDGSPDTGLAADDDGAPEVVSSKIPATPVHIPKAEAGKSRERPTSECSRKNYHPKKSPRNPFVSRSTLLRNLLLPEIRITVSNLSQTIRFLVENDFLRNVELQPGEAQEQMIKVLGSSDTL